MNPTGGQVIPLIIAAGATMQASASGTQFYVVAAPGPVQINAGNGFSTYYQGTGAETGGQFTLLQVKNPGNAAILVQIYIGFSRFIDHRTIPLAPAEVPIFVCTNWSSPNGWTSDSYYGVPDQSGQFAQNQADGLNYYLVSRTNLYITNLSTDANNAGSSILLGTGEPYSSATGVPVTPVIIRASAGGKVGTGTITPTITNGVITAFVLTAGTSYGFVNSDQITFTDPTGTGFVLQAVLNAPNFYTALTTANWRVISWGAPPAPIAVLPSISTAAADAALLPFTLPNIAGYFFVKANSNSMTTFKVYVAEIYQGIPALAQ